MKPDADGLITELRQTLGKMEVALGAIADAIAWTDEDGRIQWCNASFDRLVGRQHIEVLGSKFIDLVPLESQGQGVLPENHPLSMILKSPTSASGIYDFQQADRRLVLDISGRYIRLPEHQASAVIMIRDITELSKAKELLEKEIAEIVRLEQERNHMRAREIEIAKQVQSRFFPQKAHPLQTLEYVGDCVQARSVGGDYYDFLELAPGQLGLVLADISGKGISAALLMANLQASVRSQYSLAVDDLARLLQSVNHLFYESSAPGHFATFFFGRYEDATRRLCYANCGHNPPLLLRGNGTVERLKATATVVGLFKQWDCLIDEVTLASGDTLVIFSDGVTETTSEAGVEFGDERLLETLRANCDLPVSALLGVIVADVQQFSGPEQRDDRTLVVARAR